MFSFHCLSTCIQLNFQIKKRLKEVVSLCGCDTTFPNVNKGPTSTWVKLPLAYCYRLSMHSYSKYLFIVTQKYQHGEKTPSCRKQFHRQHLKQQVCKWPCSHHLPSLPWKIKQTQKCSWPGFQRPHLFCDPQTSKDNESIGINRCPLKSVSLTSDVPNVWTFTGTITEPFKDINFWVLLDIILMGSHSIPSFSHFIRVKASCGCQLYLRCPEVTEYSLDFEVPNHSVVANICSTKCSELSLSYV